MKSKEQSEIQLEDSWLQQVGAEFEQEYMLQLKDFLLQRKCAGAIIYPPGKQIFNALNSTPFEQVKVVILGQDPYHGAGQAHGLSFSVPAGVVVPPSLRNIYKELHSDCGVTIPVHGCLEAWADQGVLLLNAVLTVEQGQAGAHQNKGWERFTDQIIQALNARRKGLVFMLWGAYAQRKAAILDAERHYLLRAPHPSPLSAYRGFLGCQHFSKANCWLQKQGEEEIDWQLAIKNMPADNQPHTPKS